MNGGIADNMNSEVLQAWHIVGDDVAQVTPISVVVARYFPTDDGRSDETYEVVLRRACVHRPLRRASRQT